MPRILRQLLVFVLGTLATVILLEVVLAGGQWAFVRWQTAQNLAALEEGRGEVRILTIGESTTAVAGDEDGRMLVPHTSYPVQLERILQERAPDIDWQVINIGMMGGTTPAVLEMLGPAVDRYEPHIIIAMMGIKDTPDLGMPGAVDLPWPLSRLHSVDLLLRLLEDRELRENELLTEVESIEDLPEGVRPGRTQLRKFVREIRLDEQSPAYAALGDLELATYLWFIQRHARAEAILRDVIATHDVGYNLLARVLVTNGEHERAWALLETAIEKHPDEAMYRVSLIEALVEQGALDRAEAVLAEAVQGSFVGGAYVANELHLVEALVHKAGARYDEALAALDAVDQQVSPTEAQRKWWVSQRTSLKSRRGAVCLDMGDLPCAAAQLEEAVKASPGDHANMWLLSKVYRAQGEFDKEAALRRELLTVSGRMAEYHELAKLFRQTGHAERVPALFDEAVAGIPSLRESHTHLYELSRQRGIHVVVMQYPTFSLEDLHKYAPPAPGVSFVDNARVFQADPDGYFHEPGFPHSFSHYTKQGAEVLAEHVADHLLTLR